MESEKHQSKFGLSRIELAFGSILRALKLQSLICSHLGHVPEKREWIKTWRNTPVFPPGKETSGYQKGYDVICSRCFETLERHNVDS